MTYTLVVNERQLHYLREAMRHFIGNDPGWEADELGQDIPTVLCEMLHDPLAPSPAINGLTL